MVPGGRDCCGRDPRQLGGVAGGSRRRAVETLDRTTNTDRRGERFNYLGDCQYAYLSDLADCNIFDWLQAEVGSSLVVSRVLRYMTVVRTCGMLLVCK